MHSNNKDELSLRWDNVPKRDDDIMTYYKEHAAASELTKPKYIEYSFYEVFQRFVDIIVSLVGLVVSLPIIAIFGILIKLDTPGPAFYIQKRVGKGGKAFNIYKLRSMVVNAEKNGARWADKNDDRVTRIGRFIRKTRIDELPQFLNVLKGDMSLIGPRPERPEFTLEFNKEIPGFIERLQVKPGITGWAQVNGGYDISPKEKLKLDMYYIENRGIKLDIVILLKTIGVLFTGNGAR